MEMSENGEISGEIFWKSMFRIWHDFSIGFSGKKDLE